MSLNRAEANTALRAAAESLYIFAYIYILIKSLLRLLNVVLVAFSTYLFFKMAFLESITEVRAKKPEKSNGKQTVNYSFSLFLFGALFALLQDEALRGDVFNDAEFRSIPFINTNEFDYADNANGSVTRAFLFIDSEENLQIATPELFCKKLKCKEQDKIKVISIFGNTGDGKSHTMNEVFFDGRPVFKTSQEQSSCTIGVYAAMQRKQGVLCLDTEGLLGSTATSNKRMRMLLKVSFDFKSMACNLSICVIVCIN